MRDLEFYKALRDALKEQSDMSPDDFIDLLSTHNESNPYTVEVNGETISLTKDNVMGDYEIARLSDPIQFCYMKVNKDDDYIIYAEGYYDSWSGGEYDGNWYVGTIEQHTIDYPAEAK